ncbi:hypothetical protein LNQ03_23025 [Klebsiella pneumoniae subsp. pneumoniae]|nr:hypothetical protein [Klebsiella pneumoniae subsp. pneumoniae]
MAAFRAHYRAIRPSSWAAWWVRGAGGEERESIRTSVDEVILGGADRGDRTKSGASVRYSRWSC